MEIAFSSIALALSVASLIVSVLTWRADGARLRVHFVALGDMAAVSVTNYGRADTSISGIRALVKTRADFDSRNGRTLAWVRITWQGPQCPYRVIAGADQSWTVSRSAIESALGHPLTWRTNVQMVVFTGHGSIDSPLLFAELDMLPFTRTIMWIGRHSERVGRAIDRHLTRQFTAANATEAEWDHEISA